MDALVTTMDIERVNTLMTQMRSAFEDRRWDDAVMLFDELSQLRKLSRNNRVEATCLAARALVAQANRAAARKLLSTVADMEYAKAAPYAQLAQAYMDLKNYKEAARHCERVVALDESARQRKAASQL